MKDQDLIVELGQNMLKRIFGAILVIVALCSASLADDWVAQKLRGGVFVFQSGEWVQIERGHVVSDDSAIQTAKGARVLFARGQETIDVRGDTRIRISDRGNAKRTVVSQDFGEITVDVEKRNVQHFEVRAPLLAAVVKGTKFTVTASNGKASIKVERGRVEARDNKAGMKVDVKPKQEVKLDMQDKPVLTVEGRGAKEPIRSTSNGTVLSIRQVIEKAEKAHPLAPVTVENVQKIATQQNQPMSNSDLELAAESELKAAKKSGDLDAIAKAQASAQSVKEIEQASASSNAVAAASAAASQSAAAVAQADQAKAEKKEAEEKLKEAKESGDEAEIAAAKKAAAKAKADEKAAQDAADAAEKTAKEADEKAKKAAKDAADAAKEAAKDAEKASKDADEKAKKAAQDAADAAEKAAKEADDKAKKAAKDAADAAKDAKKDDKKDKKDKKDDGIVGGLVKSLLGGGDDKKDKKK